MDWFFETELKIETTPNITVKEVSEKKRYGWIINQKITFNSFHEVFAGTYKCISSIVNPVLRSIKEKFHSLSVPGKQ